MTQEKNKSMEEMDVNELDRPLDVVKIMDSIRSEACINNTKDNEKIVGAFEAKLKYRIRVIFRGYLIKVKFFFPRF